MDSGPGAQLVPQVGIHPYDPEVLANEGLLNDCNDGINYASLSQICISLGNAYTRAIANSTWQPWFTGDDIWTDAGGGVGKNTTANQTMGSPSGGDTVSW